jgi:hypothetical protein
MWDNARNLKTSELEVRDHLNHLEREWLIGRLVSKGGVRDVLYLDDDPHRLIVEYDADLVNSSDLLDFLYTCGLQAQPAPLAGHRNT